MCVILYSRVTFRRLYRRIPTDRIRLVIFIFFDRPISFDDTLHTRGARVAPDYLIKYTQLIASSCSAQSVLGR